MTAVTMTGTTRSTLRAGDRGDEVKYLQILLNHFYYNSQLVADGIFGSQTEARVKLFQSDCTLAVDGIVGEQTWRYLEEITLFSQTERSTLHRSSTGSEVKYLQARLNEYYRKAKFSQAYGSKIQVDGNFGAQTEDRVKQFQTDVGLMADGIVGDRTWNALEHSDYDV